MNIKRIIRLGLIYVCVITLTGCFNNSHTGSKLATSNNSVDKVLNSQINGQSESSEEISDSTDKAENEAYTSSVDYDLTNMSGDMVYAMVFQMMNNPKEYIGKRFRISGSYYADYYDGTQKYYHYCIIQDALACCAQGMEFVWEDGSHIYPDEYPERNSTITVEGVFETYREEGDKSLYCRLADAVFIR